MEVPRYQWPSWRSVGRKLWFRLREFVLVAWPLLIVGSVVLGGVEYIQWTSAVNTVLSPLTWLLGLPPVVGMTLVFGVLRKELSLIMLVQALGTTNVLSVLTPAQIMAFTVFVTFYIPCIATIGILIKELGGRWSLAVVGITLTLAIVLASLTRLLLTI